MASLSFAPPAKLAFVMGETERKMDMALDDIIKMSRVSAKEQQRRRSFQYKNGQKKAGAKSKAVVQANIAARSSFLRQKKIKQARSQSGYGYVTAKYAAFTKAIPAVPVTALSLRNQSRRRRGNPRPAVSFNLLSSCNINIPVRNNTALQIRKKPFLGGRRNLNFSLNPRPILLQPSDYAHQVYNKNPTGQTGTLDSLFARMRKQRRVSQLHNHGRRFSNRGGM